MVTAYEREKKIERVDISTPRTPARCHFCEREWWFAEGQERRCPICLKEI